MKSVSALIVFALLFLWFVGATEVEPVSTTSTMASSRFVVLQWVVDAANAGFHYQLGPGKPMEQQWEDPGLGFLTVTWGFLKRVLGLGALEVHADPYRVEFFVILLVFGLLYARGLFDLPEWFYLAVPVAVLLFLLPWWQWTWWGPSFTSFPNDVLYRFYPHGVLYLSVSTHWSKVLAALWTAAVTVQIAQWHREAPRRVLDRGRVARLIVYGMVLGLLASIRKDVFWPALLAVAILALTLLMRGFRQSAGQPHTVRLKRLVSWAAVVMLLVIGDQAYMAMMKATWAGRDRVYTMGDHPRINGHPTWHVMYISLGYVPNDLGIKWLDELGWEHVRRISGNENIVYGTAEHERASRRLFFRTVYDHPGLVVRNFVARTRTLATEQGLHIFVVGVSLAAIMLLDAPLAGVLLGNWLACAVTPAIVFPNTSYYLDFIASGVWVISVAMVLGALAVWRVIASSALAARVSSGAG